MSCPVIRRGDGMVLLRCKVEDVAKFAWQAGGVWFAPGNCHPCFDAVVDVQVAEPEPEPVPVVEPVPPKAEVKPKPEKPPQLF